MTTPSDDNIDWEAAFQKITDTPEMQALVGRIAEQHPQEYVSIPEDAILIKVKDDRAIIGINMNIEGLQSLVSAYAHVQHHRCVPAAEYMEELLRNLVYAGYVELSRQGKLPPPDMGHEEGPSGPEQG